MGGDFQPDRIGTGAIRNGTLQGADVNDDSIGSVDIRDGSLTGADFQDNLGGNELADGAVGDRELAHVFGGWTGTRTYGDHANVAQLTVDQDGRVTQAASIPITAGLSGLYFREGSFQEGGQLCCDGSDILVNGHWTSYLGHHNSWYVRTSPQCMRFYEGFSRAESGSAQILCARPVAQGSVPVTGSFTQTAPASPPPSETIDGSVTLSHSTGGSPTCPAGTGRDVMRKWDARTCGTLPDDGCTTPAGWSLATPGCSWSYTYSCNCTTTTSCVGGQDEQNCTGVTTCETCPGTDTCTATSWSEVICLGN